MEKLQELKAQAKELASKDRTDVEEAKYQAILAEIEELEKNGKRKAVVRNITVQIVGAETRVLTYSDGSNKEINVLVGTDHKGNSHEFAVNGNATTEIGGFPEDSVRNIVYEERIGGKTGYESDGAWKLHTVDSKGYVRSNVSSRKSFERLESDYRKKVAKDELKATAENQGMEVANMMMEFETRTWGKF